MQHGVGCAESTLTPENLFDKFIIWVLWKLLETESSVIYNKEDGCISFESD